MSTGEGHDVATDRAGGGDSADTPSVALDGATAGGDLGGVRDVRPDGDGLASVPSCRSGEREHRVWNGVEVDGDGVVLDAAVRGGNEVVDGAGEVLARTGGFGASRTVREGVSRGQRGNIGAVGHGDVDIGATDGRISEGGESEAGDVILRGGIDDLETV